MPSPHAHAPYSHRRRWGVTEARAAVAATRISRSPSSNPTTASCFVPWPEPTTTPCQSAAALGAQARTKSSRPVPQADAAGTQVTPSRRARAHLVRCVLLAACVCRPRSARTLAACACRPRSARTLAACACPPRSARTLAACACPPRSARTLAACACPPRSARTPRGVCVPTSCLRVPLAACASPPRSARAPRGVRMPTSLSSGYVAVAGPGIGPGSACRAASSVPGLPAATAGCERDR